MRVLSDARLANVIALLALVVALGGTSYAAIKLPKNSVGSAQIKTNAVKSSDVKNGGLRAADFKKGELSKAVKILASGETLEGIFAGAGGNNQFINIAIDFVPRLASSIPSAKMVRVTAGTAPHCPGIGKADAGYFCLYETASSGVGFSNFGNPATAEAGGDRRGTNVFYTSLNDSAYVYGVWAYKAA